MRILLTGSTGFVGRGILPTLVKQGYKVTCLVRPDSIGKLQRAPEWQEHVELLPGDLFDLPSLEKAVAGTDAIIHLVGIIREKPAQGITFPRVHVTGTNNLLQAARGAGIQHFIHMSALGARENAASMYHQTKFQAEQAVMNSGIPYTIFRPSVIFGPGDEFVTMLADLVRLPVTPVIGSGTYQLQPVSRQTVADVFTQALTIADARNRIFEVGGPEALTYLQILDAVGSAVNKQKVRKIHIPVPLMKPMVAALEGFSFFPITSTQLIMLEEGNTCKDTDTLYRVFQTDKIPFASGIKTYIK